MGPCLKILFTLSIMPKGLFVSRRGKFFIMAAPLLKGDNCFAYGKKNVLLFPVYPSFVIRAKNLNLVVDCFEEQMLH